MTNIRCHTLSRRVSLVLVSLLLLTMVAPPGTVLIRRADAQGGAKTILAFPAVDESEAQNLDEVAARLTSALALAGREVKDVDLEVFSETSPVVRRGIADGVLRTADVEGPKTPNAAILIGRVFKVDSVVLVSVQSMTIAGDPLTAEVSVAGTEYGVEANIDPATGMVAEEPAGTTFGVSGTSQQRGRGGDNDALMRLAARNAAYKIISVLAGKSAEEFVTEGARPKKKSDMWKYVAIGLVALGLLAVTAGGGNDNGGPTPDELLPTRLSARPTTDGIRLTWVAPTTTKTIFAYQIQRSVNGSAFVRIDGDKVGPSATSFTDFNTVAGTAYQYQIRVLYTDGTRSRWATFTQVVTP